MAPGLLPQSRDQLEARLVAAFEDALINAMLVDSEGDTLQNYLHQLLALPGHNFLWFFDRLVYFDSIGDFYLFKKIWQMTNLTNLDLLTFFRWKRSFDHYLQLHKELNQEDEYLDKVM
ncbi:hypothetical protein FQN57_003746 [Myotisia sp. PD_48]|nr:hypothetical protein FQN57_003746 [Myotisia sp. PD_48]